MKNKLEDIVEILVDFAKGDFIVTKPCRSKDEEVIAMFYGLKMLGTEIKDRIDQVESLSLKRLREKEELRVNMVEKSRLEEANRKLEQFSYVAAHDLKSPLNNINSLTEFFLKEYKKKIDSNGIEILELVVSSSEKLRNMIDSLREFSQADTIGMLEKTLIDPKALKNDIETLLLTKNTCKINLITELDSIEVNEQVINQIMINLVSNALKYSINEVVEIDIGITDQDEKYEFFVKDDGPGIALEDQETIFQMFQVTKLKDRYGNRGSGTGLATVKRLVEVQGGSIRVDSQIGQGSKFTFTINK